MDRYEIWVNLKDSRKDLEFAAAVDAYLGHLKSQGKCEGWTLTRRKFGFGPPGIGEFHISIHFKGLTQMDAAFSIVATREGEIERLHLPVYSMVTDFTAGLYRDFPDPVRTPRP